MQPLKLVAAGVRRSVQPNPGYAYERIYLTDGAKKQAPAGSSAKPFAE